MYKHIARQLIMTQHFRLYLFNLLFVFLLFEPTLSASNEPENARQDRASYIDTHKYYTENYGGLINQRNLNYQPYQADQQRSLQPQYQQQAFQQQRYGPQDYFPSNSDFVQSAPPEQNNRRKYSTDASFEDKIHTIFRVGKEEGVHLFNTTVVSNFNSSDSTQSDELPLNGTDATSVPTSTSSPSSSSSSTTSMISQEPTFKVQRTTDGKLSLVFNDLFSLQRPTNPPGLQPVRPYKHSEIIFPTQPQSETAFNGCDSYEGQSLCKKARNYPRLVQLDTLLQREFSKFGLFFAEDLEQPKNISQRFGGDLYEVDPCESVEKIIYPEAGQTIDSRWMLIVNDGNNYKQGIRIEECIGREQPCRVIDEFLPKKYRSICKQNYIYRSLVAITENGTLTKEQFQIPSCCKCVLHET